jgi:hypothetical protein
MAHSYTREAKNKKKHARRTWRITYTLIEGPPPKQKRAAKTKQQRSAKAPRKQGSQRGKRKGASTQESFGFTG